MSESTANDEQEVHEFPTIVEHASRTCPTCRGNHYEENYTFAGTEYLICPDCTDGRVAVPTTECPTCRLAGGGHSHFHPAPHCRPASWAEFRPDDRVLAKNGVGYICLIDPFDRWPFSITRKPGGEGGLLGDMDASELTLDLDHESGHRKLNPAWRFPQ